MTSTLAVAASFGVPGRLHDGVPRPPQHRRSRLLPGYPRVRPLPPSRGEHLPRPSPVSIRPLPQRVHQRVVVLEVENHRRAVRREQRRQSAPLALDRLLRSAARERHGQVLAQPRLGADDDATRHAGRAGRQPRVRRLRRGGDPTKRLRDAPVAKRGGAGPRPRQLLQAGHLAKYLPQVFPPPPRLGPNGWSVVRRLAVVRGTRRRSR
mmetsp:Transcript_2997/g.11766  ORF Transcript_2997/g.11766 Transcript_2997/m.11766 type:complete len:208 (-) Transcript_2997:1198-1821(-)